MPKKERGVDKVERAKAKRARQAERRERGELHPAHAAQLAAEAARAERAERIAQAWGGEDPGPCERCGDDKYRDVDEFGYRIAGCHTCGYQEGWYDEEWYDAYLWYAEHRKAQ